jgi:hypothetical protein
MGPHDLDGKGAGEFKECLLCHADNAPLAHASMRWS